MVSDQIYSLVLVFTLFHFISSPTLFEKLNRSTWISDRWIPSERPKGSPLSPIDLTPKLSSCWTAVPSTIRIFIDNMKRTNGQARALDCINGLTGCSWQNRLAGHRNWRKGLHSYKSGASPAHCHLEWFFVGQIFLPLAKLDQWLLTVILIL